MLRFRRRVTGVSSVASHLREARPLLVREASMRKLFLVVPVALVGCAANPPGGGDDQPAGPDAGPGGTDGPVGKACALAESMPDTGALTATKTQRCNVPNTMGTRKWYRMFASIPNSPMDIVQLELWDGQGAFAGGVVRTGTFQLTGAELSYTTCGVCVRAVGDKGVNGTKLYFATGGTVEVSSVGLGG